MTANKMTHRPKSRVHTNAFLDITMIYRLLYVLVLINSIITSLQRLPSQKITDFTAGGVLHTPPPDRFVLFANLRLEAQGEKMGGWRAGVVFHWRLLLYNCCTGAYSLTEPPLQRRFIAVSTKRSPTFAKSRTSGGHSLIDFYPISDPLVPDCCFSLESYSISC